MSLEQTDRPVTYVAADHAPEIETREAVAVTSEAPMPAPSRLQLALNEVVPFLAESVRQYMPPSPFREYYLWGLDPQNPYHDAWISVTGLKQIVDFTLRTMAASLPDAHIPSFARYAAPMCIYLNFEVVSDNLEFGLSDTPEGDRTHYLRAHMIREFTHAMCLRLSGTTTPAADLLAREQGIARRISSQLQTLSPEKHRLIADAFLRQHPHVAPKEIEYSLLPLLIMNIETAADLVQRTCHYTTGTLLQKTLYRRYRSAERIFRDPNLDLPQVVWHGAHTILLIPVLAYYFEMSAHLLNIPDQLQHAVFSGHLPRALHQCSVMVRLLNDLGTPLVTQSEEQRRAMVRQLRHDARQMRVNNIRMFLRSRIEDNLDYRDLLVRVAKDVETGEFNIALYNLPHINPLDRSLAAFGERLTSLSRIYHQTHADWDHQLAHLTDMLGTDAFSRMLRRVLDFHVGMYGNDYRQAEGDFAV